MLDELLVGGEIQESSKKNIIRAVTAQDVLQEVRNWACVGSNNPISSFPCAIGDRKPKKFTVFIGRNGTSLTT